METSPTIRKIAALALAGVFGFSLAACDKKETDGERGTAEKAGEKIDQAADTAAEKINEAATAAGRSIERAGEKLHDKAEDAKH